MVALTQNKAVKNCTSRLLSCTGIMFSLSVEMRSHVSPKCFPYCDKYWRSFEYLLCVFSSAQLGASLRLTTDLKNSLSLSVLWQPLSLLFYPHSLHNVTRATLWTAKKKKERNEMKETDLFLPQDSACPLIVSSRGICASFFGERS